MKEPSPCQNPECQQLAKRFVELEQVVAQLQKRIEELEEELRKTKRQAHPFSRNKTKDTKKKPGRKPGHGHFAHKEPPKEEEVQFTLTSHLASCPDCGSALEDRQVHVNWQSDIPQVKAEVTRYESESGWCPTCRKRKRRLCSGQLVSASGAASHGLGPRVKAWSADLKQRHGLPYSKQVDILASLFHLKVTTSGLIQSAQKLSQKLAGVYEELANLLSEAATVHSDETGWRIGSLKAWLWVLTNPEVTLYRIETHKGHEVLLEVLGEDYQGVLHSDRAKAYNHKKLAKWLKQKCLAHLLKNLSQLEVQQQKGAVRFAREVSKLLREALKLRDKQKSLESGIYAKRCQTLEKKLDKVIGKQRQFSNLSNAKMAESLRRYRGELFGFLYNPLVEATNNRAERDLRPAVIARKIGRCNKTEQGAKTYAVLSSIIATLVKQGYNPLSALQELLLSETPSLAILNSS